MRATLHYLGMMIIIPLYGIQVCPFIEGLNATEVFVTFDAFLLAAFVVRNRLIVLWVDRSPLAGQARRLFISELSVILTTGLLLGIYNMVLNGFPLQSGLKVLVGFAAMGLFAATDTALERERLIAGKVEREGLVLEISGEFFPLTSKLALYAIAYVLLLVGVFSLVMIKDLEWLIAVENEMPLREAQTSILKEFAFVLAVVMVETVNIIISYTRNLKMFLVRENGVLARVTSGYYDTRVPISSNDEFGVMAVHTNEMIRRIRQRTRELNLTRDVTIHTLASLAETRDNETGAHILRTQRYVRALARQLQSHPRFSDVLDEAYIDLLYKSAPLHDIGKVGIPDPILLKPGKLTEDEFRIMKGHAKIGADALEIAENELGSNSFLRLAREISLTHHEKWDGSGYPAGLRGDDIPISGRLMAVADVYDALISKRVYKPPYPHQRAMDILREGSATHFDPDVIEALNAVESEFQEIAETHRDDPQSNPLKTVS